MAGERATFSIMATVVFHSSGVCPPEFVMFPRLWQTEQAVSIVANVRFLLVVRVFELWTHDNDLRRAVGLSRVELYDPTTGTFNATASLSTARASHSATLLPDGTVLVAGGA